MVLHLGCMVANRDRASAGSSENHSDSLLRSCFSLFPSVSDSISFFILEELGPKIIVRGPFGRWARLAGEARARQRQLLF